jgi:hypothetical protein
VREPPEADRHQGIRRREICGNDRTDKRRKHHRPNGGLAGKPRSSVDDNSLLAVRLKFFFIRLHAEVTVLEQEVFNH